VAAFALPATLQFLVKKATLPSDPMPAPMVRAMRALAARSAPGDVVMQRPGARFPPAPVILIGRRVPYERFTPYLTQFAAREELQARHETVFRFFRTTDAAEALEIARRLHARWLCLYGGDRVRFAGVDLDPVHEEEGARCYTLPAGGPSAQSPTPSSTGSSSSPGSTSNRADAASGTDKVFGFPQRGQRASTSAKPTPSGPSS
jgi:hypothetical protein